MEGANPANKHIFRNSIVTNSGFFPLTRKRIGSTNLLKFGWGRIEIGVPFHMLEREGESELSLYEEWVVTIEAM